MTYLDTSALIKRFVPEKGSPLVRALVRTDMIATAKIAYAEVYATLTRKKREGGLSEAHYGLVCRAFELDWQIRDRLSTEIAGMNHEEIIRWLRSQRYSNPFLQRLADKAAQRGDLPADGAARPPRGGEVAVGRLARRKALTRRLEHGHVVADTPTVGYE